MPSASNVLGAASAGAGGLLLFLGGWRRRQALAGWLAGLLLALSPLLWLALGMETAFCIALALAAFAADDLGTPPALPTCRGWPSWHALGGDRRRSMLCRP